MSSVYASYRSSMVPSDEQAPICSYLRRICLGFMLHWIPTFWRYITFTERARSRQPWIQRRLGSNMRISHLDFKSMNPNKPTHIDRILLMLNGIEGCEENMRTSLGVERSDPSEYTAVKSHHIEAVVTALNQLLVLTLINCSQIKLKKARSVEGLAPVIEFVILIACQAAQVQKKWKRGGAWAGSFLNSNQPHSTTNLARFPHFSCMSR